MRHAFSVTGIISEILLTLLIQSLLRKRTPLKNSIVSMLISAFAAVAAHIIIALSGNPRINIFAFALYFSSVDFITYFLLKYSLIYTNKLGSLKKYADLWRLIIHIDTLCIFISIWSEHMYSMDTILLSDGDTAYITHPTMWFNLHLALCYAPIIVALYALTDSFIRSHSFYKLKYFPILISVLLIVLLNIAYMYFSLPYDWSVMFYALAGFLLCYYSFRFIPGKIMNSALRLAVDSMRESLYLFDAEKNCIYVNKTAREITDNPDGTITFNEYPITLWLEGKDKNDPKDFVETFTMIDKGVEYKVRVTYKNCLDSKNNNLGSFFLFEDVTEEHLLMESLIEARSEADQANVAKSLFLANMSHEIRTPINSILGMNEMILRECTDTGILEYADDIRNSGNTLLSLINNILDLSKIESGKMDITPAEYTVYDMIRQCHTLVAPRAAGKDLPIIFNCDENIPLKLLGDSERIKQILVNLLTNSIKYTQTGNVTLKASWEETENSTGNLKIIISDTGRGISEEDMSKLFRIFQRIDEKNNRNVEGTGLGLAISRELARMMNGRIEVSSVKGKGSDFTLIIPQSIVDASPSGKFSVQKTEKHARKTYKESFHAPNAKILSVDDIEMNLKLINALLKKTEIKIVNAGDGNTAIELCRKEKFDLILMDHMMPPPDGLETMKAIRNEGGLNTDTPIIVLTANAVEGAEKTYLEMGFDSYLSKPVKSRDLEDMIRRYIPEDKVLPG